MKRDERSRHLTEIFDRLDELDELDRTMIQHETHPPGEILLQEFLQELKARRGYCEERERLHGALRKLAARPIED